MPLTSVDFPEPLTPVTAVSTLSGKLTSMPFKLFWRAPTTLIAWFHDRLEVGISMVSLPVRYCMVCERGYLRAISAGCCSTSWSGPLNTISPPNRPASGPTSMRVSAAHIISLSCSTTMTVLPKACSFFSTSMSRCVSRLCRPMLGSSKM